MYTRLRGFPGSSTEADALALPADLRRAVFRYSPQARHIIQRSGLEWPGLEKFPIG